MNGLTVQRQNTGLLRWGFTLKLDAEFVGVWEGVLTPIARPYRVKIVYFPRRDFGTYRLANHYVSVIVIDPEIGPDPRGTGEPAPHIYAYGRPPERPALCLFDHRESEWLPDQQIGDAIIPWTLEWLLFFEEWVRSGEWLPGGRHPEMSGAPCQQTTSSRGNDGPLERYLNDAFHKIGLEIGHFGSYRWMGVVSEASSPPLCSTPSNGAICPDDL